MILRTTLAMLLAGVLFTGCQESNSTADAIENEAEETVSEIEEPANELASEMDTDYYTREVTDPEPKSPRKKLTSKVNDIPVVIDYGSPAVNERTIYGELVPFNKVWRTGANAATQITFEEDVMVGESGTKLSAGTYALFSRPASKTEWEIIFNSKADQWGAYDHKEEQDVATIKADGRVVNSSAERMDFAIDENDIMLMWDDVVVSFPVRKAAK